jgi:hypothetical protein
MEIDNPASRLLTLLETCRAHPKPSHSTVRVALHTVLDVPADQPALLFSRLAQFMALPQEVMDMLAREGIDGRASHHWHNQVLGAFGTLNLEAGWDSFLAYIDENCIAMLRMTSWLLDRSVAVKKVDKDALASFYGEVNDLLEAAISSDIQPVELKLEIVKALKDIQNAIDEARISGISPVLRAIDRLNGLEKRGGAEKEFFSISELGKKINATLETAANTVTVMSYYPQFQALLSAGQRLLT